MSYAKIEGRIRADALKDVARRAEDLEGQLDEAGASGDAPSPEHERELRYLERMAAAAHPADRRSDLAARISALRRRFDDLVRQEAARAAHAAGAARGDPESFRPPALSFRTPPLRSTRAGSEAGAAPTPVSQVASFLRRPEQPLEESEDEVRLLSAEGRLAQELQRFPMLSVPGTESTLVFRRLPPELWTDADDEQERQRDRLAVLELQQAAVNLREVQDLVAQHVGQDQGRFDAVEQQVAEARSRTGEAVVTLASANTDIERRLAWLAPSVGLAILGGGIIAIAPAAASGAVICVVVRGGITVGAALGFHLLGSYKLKQWQEHAMRSMTEHLPSAFDQLPEPEVKMLVGAGNEAQRRLLQKLADEGSWSGWPSPSAWKRGLRARCRRSDLREGHAFATSFTTKRIGAREAFQIVRQLSIAGSCDPQCQVVWSRPLDEDQQSTSLRYLIFSDPLGTRDFYCVCRSIQVSPLPSEQEDPAAAAPESFAFAVMTLAPELLASTGLPDSNKGMEHGRIHISGIIVSDDGAGGCKVEVMADVDVGHPWFVPTMAVDCEVRLHVLRTAEKLSLALASAAKAAAG